MITRIPHILANIDREHKGTKAKMKNIVEVLEDKDIILVIADSLKELTMMK